MCVRAVLVENVTRRLQLCSVVCMIHTGEVQLFWETLVKPRSSQPATVCVKRGAFTQIRRRQTSVLVAHRTRRACLCSRSVTERPHISGCREISGILSLQLVHSSVLEIWQVCVCVCCQSSLLTYWWTDWIDWRDAELSPSLWCWKFPNWPFPNWPHCESSAMEKRTDVSKNRHIRFKLQKEPTVTLTPTPSFLIYQSAGNERARLGWEGCT